MQRTDPAISWLLESGDPSVKYCTLTDVLEEPQNTVEVRSVRRQIPNGPLVKTLLKGQHPDGGFGVHPYQKWTGAHWRRVSLVELGVPAGFPPAVKATKQILDWLTGDDHLHRVKEINGLTRRCASQEGNALAVCSRLGLARDQRVAQIAKSLVKWQWPDGGWNCDPREDVKHSSFNESLATLWGLVEYSRATGDGDSLKAADMAAEFFLRHRIFRSCRSNDERSPETFHGEIFHHPFTAKSFIIFLHPWTQLHYPLYWHYDILQALLILSRAGKLNDPRSKEALDLVRSKRGLDGLWRPEAYYWTKRRAAKSKVLGMQSNVEVIDWGRGRPNMMMTLNALRVLNHSNRVN